MQLNELDFDYALSAAYASSSFSTSANRGHTKPTSKQTNKKGSKGPTGTKALSSQTARRGDSRGRGARPGGGSRQRREESLDGLPVPSYHTVSGGFGTSTLTNVELRHSGINAAIPSKRRGRNIHLEKFVDPEEIPLAFKQHVSRGGNAIVSEQQVSEIQVQFPQWITLRESYLSQLKDMCELLQKSKHLLQEDARRQHFLLLLLALRKVSIRIIGEMDDLGTRCEDPEHKAAVKEVKKYVRTMPTNLDFLHATPFAARWIGVNPLLNPLLSLFSISGSVAGETLAHDLEMNAEEQNLCDRMGRVLWQLHCQDVSNVSRLPSSFGETDQRLLGLEDEDEDDFAAREELEVRIQSLMTQASAGIQKSSQNRLLKVFLTGKSTLQHSWRTWRRAFNIHAKIPIMKRNRDHGVKRKIFDLLYSNVWQCVKYRALQRRYYDRITVITFDAWKEYLKWSRRFHKIYQKSIRRIKRLFFRAIKRFADEVFDHRRFRYNNGMRNKRICFKALRQNIILSKFELKKRLETMSSASFIDRHTSQTCFKRWAKRSRLVLQLDDLEEKVEALLMKSALIRWALFAWPVLPPQVKLSFAEKMKLRLQTTFTSTPLLIAPPEPEEKSIAGGKMPINPQQDERRRERMRTALALARAKRN